MMTHRLTTIDNPYDVFDEYDEWYTFDMNANHHTPALLARVANVSNDLSDRDYNLAIEDAIDDIIALDPLLIYKKVSRDVA